MTERLRVEVVYALPEAQTVVALTSAPGRTVADAVEASGLMAQYPELQRRPLCVGIFGRRVTADTILKNGDRVEIYRPLLIDPKEARRIRAGAEAEVKAGERR